MTARTDSALASLLLSNRLFDVDAQPLRSREYWELVERVEDPARLLGAAPEQIAAGHDVHGELAARVATLLGAGTALALHLEELEHQGVGAVSPFDPDYPAVLRARLGAAAPPVLYLAGPATLLHSGGLAVVGSRNVNDAGARVAQEAARLAAYRGWTVVSGGAKGTDRLAMDAAHRGGGAAVGVLADSLARRASQPDVRRAIHQEQACLVTPYKPTAGFSVAAAMGRNKIIYALADVALVVAADAEKGGTWEGAVEALRQRFSTVTVWMGDGRGPGNERLVERGAMPVTDLAAVFSASAVDPAPPASQLRLGI